MQKTMTANSLGRLPALLLAAAMAVGPAAPLSAQQAAPNQLSALAGEEALLPVLNGLRLVAVAPGNAASRQRGVEIAPRLETPAEAQLAARLQQALGQPASLESLGRLVDLVRAHFRDAGYPFTLVTLPEQDITHGTVAILVQPSRLAQAPAVDGARYFEVESYRRAIRVQPGQTINAETLEADVALLNANPYREVRLVSGPGAEPATTQLTLVTQEERPYAFTLGFSTDVFQGEASTNLNGSAVFGNFLGRGDVLRYDLGADPDNASSMAHTLSYTHFLRGNRRLEATAYYTRPENAFAGLFLQVQTTARLGLTYHARRDLDRQGEQQDWYLGLEAASEDYELYFGGTPVSNSTVDLVYLKAGWSRALQLEKGQRSYGVDLLLSPGGLTANNADDRFDEARSGASASYAIVKPWYSQTRPFGEKLSWSLSLRAQLASGALVQSQQFNAISGNAVRLGGASVSGDHGLAVQNTVSLPSFSIGGFSLSPYLMGDMAIAAYADTGFGSDEPGLALGIGGGLSGEIREGVELSLETGQLWWRADGIADSDFAVSFSLNASF
ncbi:Hemolysin activation/secretion protein [Pseudooceanicola antarcticus]|uniref:Hemolysin activation/secretion protein n=2 Tax=Pseudooceanicola antarcticus TaxID=1247613 RepID=A0A285JFV0_9RHOB|nr:ShlB/FhaC/HecB family hemolysin secretion/activation protein [Pseudooceanicola antarcticus]SNY58943.1 Hemolysin activation/secretion protein [Pseudooceanicola antarcticus]